MVLGRRLLDTNILLRMSDNRADARSQLASQSVKLLSQSVDLCYASQNIGEFWNSCTRPLDKNGFGLKPAEVLRRVRAFERDFDLLPDSRDVHREWLRLLANYEVSGAKVHDAHLVATMLVHGVTQILTFNNADFERYPEIQAVHPSEVSA